MFNHVMVGSNNIDTARRFYDAVLGALGFAPSTAPEIALYPSEGGNFVVISPRDGRPACHANGGTIGFRAKTFAEVDAFHAAGVANGGSSEGPPGVREDSPGKKYGAYLRDPDGNKICAFAPRSSS